MTDLDIDVGRRFFELSLDMLATATFDGYFRHVSPAWQRTLGWSAAELRAVPYVDLIHPEDRDDTVERAEVLASREGAVANFDNRYRTRDGTYRWLRWNATFDPTDDLVYAIARDVTEVRSRGADLERAVADRTAVLESFSYAVGHDLRAPLRVILGFSELLATDTAERLTEAEQRLLDRVRANAQLMKDRVDGLLAVCEIAGHEVTLERVDTTAEAHRVVERLPAEDQALVNIEPLPSCVADRRLLDQVLENLIGNALKFSRSGSAPHVRICGWEEGERVIIEVTDNGPGFDQAVASRLFELFVRVGQDDVPGTGVGLAIVKRIVTTLGGTVWCRSDERGATFGFALPRVEVAAAGDRSATDE
ncbi:PAS domain-containing sensor histidine kinase [Euzebya pacifica]|uniref:sensor histidine kinase n=1 Tax=Euzebya pacifica TaxID=1608957 RepID=UPI0030FA3A5B